MLSPQELVMMEEFIQPQNLLFEALTKAQPAVQVVVTAGTWIEYCLYRILRRALQYPEELGDGEVAFAPLVRLTVALGLIPRDLRKVLLQFGHIRNRFAHDIRTVFDDADLEKFMRQFPPDFAPLFNVPPPSIPKFQWVLMLLCQDLFRCVDDPDEITESTGTPPPEHREAYFGVFINMMHETEESMPKELRAVDFPRPVQDS